MTTTDEPHRVMPGMVLLEDCETRARLWCVCGVRQPRKRDNAVTATLRAYSGRNTGHESDVYASAEASATFPDGGKVVPPFYLLTAEEAVRGKWPERLR